MTNASGTTLAQLNRPSRNSVRTALHRHFFRNFGDNAGGVIRKPSPRPPDPAMPSARTVSTRESDVVPSPTCATFPLQVAPVGTGCQSRTSGRPFERELP